MCTLPSPIDFIRLSDIICSNNHRPRAPVARVGDRRSLAQPNKSVMKLQIIVALFVALLASACCNNNRRGHCGRVYQGRVVENRAPMAQTRCDTYHIHITGGDYTQSDFAEVAEAEKRRGGTPEEVRQRILQQLPGATVEVTLKGTSYSTSGNLVLEGNLNDYERNAGPLYRAAPRRAPQPFFR